jgi:hypothetical protein
MDQYGIKAIFQFTQADRERLTKLAQWVDQNNIRVNVEKTFSLDDAGKALDYQQEVKWSWLCKKKGHLHYVVVD